MVDKKKSDSKSDSTADKTASAASKKKVAKKAAASAKSETSIDTSKQSEASTVKGDASTFVPVKGSGGSAATAKAGALTDEDMIAAAKKISDAGNPKNTADEIKKRASKAKLRAQEKILEEAYVSDKPEDPLERLADTFDSSAKRWEMVVYPSLFAFVLLAGYGFFLIYRLTHDISTLSQAVTRMAVIVSDAMPRMTKDLSVMTGSIDNMTGNVDDMSTEISSMSGQMTALKPMSSNIKSMTNNIGSMNRSVYGMQRDMHGMNRTVSSGPFGMMSDMMPFSSKSNVPPPMAPPVIWPSYSYAPQQPAYKYPTQNTFQAKPVVPLGNKNVKANDKTTMNKSFEKKPVAKKAIEPKSIERKDKTVQVQSVTGARPASLKD